MEFAVQGWTTEYIVMEIDGKGVEYLGNVFYGIFMYAMFFLYISINGQYWTLLVII